MCAPSPIRMNRRRRLHSPCCISKLTARERHCLHADLWQRGISLYYAGDFEGGAEQFKSGATTMLIALCSVHRMRSSFEPV